MERHVNLRISICDSVSTDTTTFFTLDNAKMDHGYKRKTILKKNELIDM